jgi:Na+-driven multidrug efflux pump
MGAFTSDPAVILAGTDGLRVIALCMPPLAIVFVQAGGLRGCGDTRTPLWIFGIGVWVSTGLGRLALHFIGGGLVTTSLSWVIVTPVMAWLMHRSFQRRIKGFNSVTPDGLNAET